MWVDPLDGTSEYTQGELFIRSLSINIINLSHTYNSGDSEGKEKFFVCIIVSCIFVGPGVVASVSRK